MRAPAHTLLCILACLRVALVDAAALLGRLELDDAPGPSAAGDAPGPPAAGDAVDILNLLGRDERAGRRPRVARNREVGKRKNR